MRIKLGGYAADGTAADEYKVAIDTTSYQIFNASYRHASSVIMIADIQLAASNDLEKTNAGHSDSDSIESTNN